MTAGHRCTTQRGTAGLMSFVLSWRTGVGFQQRSMRVSPPVRRAFMHECDDKCGLGDQRYGLVTFRPHLELSAAHQRLTFFDCLSLQLFTTPPATATMRWSAFSSPFRLSAPSSATPMASARWTCVAICSLVTGPPSKTSLSIQKVS